MRVVAAYLLAVLGGNKSPAVADVEKILAAGGVEVEAARIEKLVAELKGKDLNVWGTFGCAHFLSILLSIVHLLLRTSFCSSCCI